MAETKADKEHERTEDADAAKEVQYRNEDGTPVEPATIPPKHPVGGEPDVAAKPGVHAV